MLICKRYALNLGHETSNLSPKHLRTEVFIDFFVPHFDRRGVRVVERARLESVYTRKGIAGSNPALSAEKKRLSPYSRQPFRLHVEYIKVNL